MSCNLLKTFLLATLSLWLLAACGAKGDLYLPKEKETQTQQQQQPQPEQAEEEPTEQDKKKKQQETE